MALLVSCVIAESCVALEGKLICKAKLANAGSRSESCEQTALAQ